MAKAARKQTAAARDLTEANASARDKSLAAAATAEPMELAGADIGMSHGEHETHETSAMGEHFEGETHEVWADGTWTPPEKLDAPTPLPGMVQRWVRVETKGEADPNNVAAQFRHGWRPRSFDTVPEGERKKYPKINIKTFGEVMKNGDLILCQMPEGIFAQMSAFYKRRAAKQVQAVSPEALVAKHNSEVDPDKGFGEITVTRRSTAGRGRMPLVAADD